MTSLREPTLYQTWTVATGALGTSTSRTFIPLERMTSRGSVAAADDVKAKTRLLAAINQDICMMCREYSQVMFGRRAHCMLATGFDLCQGTFCVFGWEIAQLAAGAEDVAPPTLTDEHIEACLSHDGLKG